MITMNLKFSHVFQLKKYQIIILSHSLLIPPSQEGNFQEIEKESRWQDFQMISTGWLFKPIFFLQSWHRFLLNPSVYQNEAIKIQLVEATVVNFTVGNLLFFFFIFDNSLELAFTCWYWFIEIYILTKIIFMKAMTIILTHSVRS